MKLITSQEKVVPVEGIDAIMCIEVTHAELIFIQESIKYNSRDAESALENEYEHLTMDQRLLLQTRLILKPGLLEKLEKEEQVLFNK